VVTAGAADEVAAAGGVDATGGVDAEDCCAQPASAKARNTTPRRITCTSVGRERSRHPY